ncbi:FHA domain-containing protein [Streptomyces sp. NPDC087212]|uniref:FHA domain-containing protein n=1 Tax=Streptomyces sp. NPDC087212 TaxID=3365766 RepID=UPI00380CFE79
MPTCPNGHQSGSDDWCEVCGHRMAGAVPPPPPPPPPAGGGYGFPPPQGGRPNPAAAPELCPQCRTPREGGAPFCEECRWNFLTNTATSYTPAAPRPAPGPPRFQQPPGPSYGGGDAYEYQGSRPSQVNRPAEPIPPFGDPSRPDQPPFATTPGPPPPPNFGAGPPRGDQQQNQPPFTPNFAGGPPRDDQQQGQPPFATNPGPPAPPNFGGGPPRPDQQNQPQPPFGNGPTRPDQQNPSGPPSPPNFGARPDQPPFATNPGPPPPPNFGGGPPEFGANPARQPSPPAPPQAFHQPGPPAPPPFPQQGGQAFGAADDDWVIPPPTSGQAAQGPQGGQGGQGGPAAGGYGYPQPPQSAQPAQTSPATWTATIGPDREYFMAMMQRSGPEATGLNLPAYSPEQQRTLTGNQVTIGRRRHSTGDTPDIDLAVPPEDPGVSHQHAVLVQQPDGNWAVVDQNSTNGTTVNGGEEPIQPFLPIPLQDGDRVHVGAWTTITIRRG